MKAYFLGYQEDAAGNWLALYNIQGGEQDGSTVTKHSLLKNKIEVPETPTVQEWFKMRELRKASK